MSLRPHERIAASLRSASAAGTPGLVAFLTAGYPSRARFRADLAAIASEADVVEIGIPFTDPMADGVTIQRSSREALRQGVTLAWILSELKALAPQPTPLVLMGYLNPLLAYGYARLATDAAAAGVCGFIVPDLPLDESAPLRTALDVEGLALIQMVTPVTTPERMARLCQASEGFVYAVTMTGTTGKGAAVPAEIGAYLRRVRELSKVPVCAGFGIRSPAQVAQLRGQVEGVIVGSALVEVLERGESPQAWLATLRSAGP